MDKENSNVVEFKKREDKVADDEYPVLDEEEMIEYISNKLERSGQELPVETITLVLALELDYMITAGLISPMD